MTCLAALLLTAGAAPQPPATTPPPPPPVTAAPAAPVAPAVPPAPAAAVATFDGNWSVVYAENVGRPVNVGPALGIQNGSVTINLGTPVTYRLDIGPGHAVQAVPAGAVSPVPSPTASAAPVTPPGAVTAPGAGGVGSGEITAPGSGTRSSRATTPAASPGAATGPGSSSLYTPSAPGRATPAQGTLQGTFILSQQYLVLSLTPVGMAALGSSPGTTTGTDVGPGAAPGGARVTTPPPVAPAPNAAGGGVRQDAFILILKRAPAAAPVR